MTGYQLWGFHPAYVGRDGFPYVLKLAGGSARDCDRERAWRVSDGGWTLGTYAAGVAPVGLRLQCELAYPRERVSA